MVCKKRSGRIKCGQDDTRCPEQPQRVVMCVKHIRERWSERRSERQSRRDGRGSKEQQVGAAGTTTAVSGQSELGGWHPPAAILWLGSAGAAPGKLAGFVGREKEFGRESESMYMIHALAGEGTAGNCTQVCGQRTVAGG